MRGGWAALTGVALSIVVASTAAWSASTGQGEQGTLKQLLPNSNSPVLLTADEVTYDQENGLVVASGHVEISQNDKVLLADRVSYSERTQVVTADGNVSIMDQEGNVIFADHMELSDDLKEGAISDIRMLLSDRSRIAAASGRRYAGNYTELNKAVYSPCELCASDPTRPPLWQIKAVKVIHDQQAKRIVYEDAWMEIYGIPVFYTPYFSHPDPTVQRQSGFLSPTFGANNNLGFQTRIPYFWVLGPDQDITLTPLITTKQSVVPQVEYRARLPDGYLQLAGSATVADRERTHHGQDETLNDQFRGNIDSYGRFDINDYWRWGFDARRETDKTYMRLYNLGNDRTLTSRLFAEGFHGRNYLAINNYAFQGTLDEDKNGEAPIVTPVIDYNFVSEPGDYGGYYKFDFNTMVLNRIEGRDSRRLSLNVGWSLPYTAPAGDIYKLDLSVRGDGYWVDDVNTQSNDVNPTGDSFSGLTGRIFPQFAFEWRYPFARTSGTVHQVLEPIVGVYASTNAGNTGKIPNEDSIGTELDDTNLFNADRFAGLDRVDNGQRVDYGLRWSAIGDGGGSTTIFLGQSFRLGGDQGVFGDGSGIEQDLSDIVGRIDIQPADWLDLLYRFRFDANSLSPRHNEVGLRIGIPEINATLSYAQIENIESSDLGKREEVYGTLSAKISDYWSTYFKAREDIDNGVMRYIGGGIAYEDECILVRAAVTHSNVEDEEVNSGTSFLFTVGFKNLGAIEVPF
jgi:LPS-assembly protein